MADKDMVESEGGESKGLLGGLKSAASGIGKAAHRVRTNPYLNAYGAAVTTMARAGMNVAGTMPKFMMYNAAYDTARNLWDRAKDVPEDERHPSPVGHGKELIVKLLTKLQNDSSNEIKSDTNRQPVEEPSELEQYGGTPPQDPEFEGGFEELAPVNYSLTDGDSTDTMGLDENKGVQRYNPGVTKRPGYDAKSNRGIKGALELRDIPQDRAQEIQNGRITLQGKTYSIVGLTGDKFLVPDPDQVDYSRRS